MDIANKRKLKIVLLVWALPHFAAGLIKGGQAKYRIHFF